MILMSQREPYEQLPPEVVDRAVSVFRQWAAVQVEKRKPILEFLDGSTLTARDLLVEAPPRRLAAGSLLQLAQNFVRRVLLRREARAWPRLLNLFAVGHIHGDEDINEMLGDFEQAAGIRRPARAE
jgi:hypothetical protein